MEDGALEMEHPAGLRTTRNVFGTKPYTVNILLNPNERAENLLCHVADFLHYSNTFRSLSLLWQINFSIYSFLFIWFSSQILDGKNM